MAAAAADAEAAAEGQEPLSGRVFEQCVPPYACGWSAKRSACQIRGPGVWLGEFLVPN